MTEKESIQILAILKAAYPNSYKNMSKDEAKGTVTVWAVQFSNIPAEVVMVAVNKLIATNVFPPSICEVKKKIGSMWWEAWEELRDNLKYKHLSDKQVKFYEMIESVAEKYKVCNTEPTIHEMLSGENPLLLGG